jgi:hypothetical protein
MARTILCLSRCWRRPPINCHHSTGAGGESPSGDCRCLLLAQNGPQSMSAIRSLPGGKRTSRGNPISVENDRGCVKTRSSQGCAELFSQSPSSDRSCQCNWIPHRRNRDGNSTRKFNVRVFTQPGPDPEVAPDQPLRPVARDCCSPTGCKLLCSRC